eukprot:COSAG02_NODE_44376_length_366_cov_10.393258_1_plen_46_part_10
MYVPVHVLYGLSTLGSALVRAPLSRIEYRTFACDGRTAVPRRVGPA